MGIKERMNWEFQHSLQEVADIAYEKGVDKREFLNEAERAWKAAHFKEASAVCDQCRNRTAARSDSLRDAINKWKREVMEMVGEQLEVSYSSTHTIEGPLGKRDTWGVTLNVKDDQIHVLYTVNERRDDEQFKFSVDADFLADMIVDRIRELA